MWEASAVYLTFFARAEQICCWSMTENTRLWIKGASITILAVLAVAFVVGMIVMYLDLVQFAHDFKQMTDRPAHASD